jgi:hypothetical protein
MAPRAARTPRPTTPAPTRAGDAAAVEELLASLPSTATGHTSMTPRMSGYLIATG